MEHFRKKPVDDILKGPLYKFIEKFHKELPKESSENFERIYEGDDGLFSTEIFEAIFLRNSELRIFWRNPWSIS